jgi:Ca2+-binding EF-hand superfamily protein
MAAPPPNSSPPSRERFRALLQDLCEEYEKLHDLAREKGHQLADIDELSLKPFLQGNGTSQSTACALPGPIINRQQTPLEARAAQKKHVTLAKPSPVGDKIEVEDPVDDAAAAAASPKPIFRDGSDLSDAVSRKLSNRNLSDAFMEQLREQFTQLDKEEQDAIPLLTLTRLLDQAPYGFKEKAEEKTDVNQRQAAVDKFYNQFKFDRERVSEVVSSLCTLEVSSATTQRDVIPSASSLSSSSSSESLFSAGGVEGLALKFDSFVNVMTIEDPKDDADEESIAMFQLKKAIVRYDEFTRAMQEAEEDTANRYNRLIFLIELVPAPVIIINSIVMGLQADFKSNTAEQVFIILEIFFLAFYISEAVVKCMVYSIRKYFCGPDLFWNWFDISCICFSLFDVVYELIVPLIAPDAEAIGGGSLMLMKMLRLAKLGRLVKAMHYPFFQELKAMVFGVMSGLRVLFWAVVLLVVIIYFLGVCARNIFQDEYPEFKDVPVAMFTVFRCFTDGCAAENGTPLLETLRYEHGAAFLLPFVPIYMFVTFGVFNLIMAIFIDNVVSTTELRKQHEIGNSSHRTKEGIQAMIAQMVIYDKSRGSRVTITKPGDFNNGKVGTVIGLTHDEMGSVYEVRMDSGRIKFYANEHLQGSRRHHILKRQKREEILKIYMKHPILAYQKIAGMELDVSKNVFHQWVRDDGFQKLLDNADICTANTADIFDVLDADMSGELTVSELVDGLMRLRGPMTKCDLIAVRMKIRRVANVVQDIAKWMKIDEPQLPADDF